MNNIFYPIERYSGWKYFDNYGALFDGLFNTPTKTGAAVSARAPVTDVSETDTAYLVKAELPGILKEDLDVTINDGYLLIEAKISDAIREGLEGVLQSVRISLRKARIGYQRLRLIENGVTVLIRNEKEITKAKNAIKKIGQGMVVEVEGQQVRIKYTEELLRDRRRAILEQAVTILNVRVNALGLTEPSIQRQGTNRILVQAPGGDPEKLKKIIYLGGLGEVSDNLSMHLLSRQQTGEILRNSEVDVTEFRSGVIVGSGSLSFEIIRNLTERLPIMICPKWVYTKTQPISVENVLEYLIHSISTDMPKNSIFEIGGEDVLSYGDMIKKYAPKPR
mgnify:CR=1 FL=1